MTATLSTTTARSHGWKLSFGHVLNSEWIKIRSLRSSFVCALLIVVLNVGFGLLVAAAIPSGTSGTDSQRDIEVLSSTVGVNFTALIAGVIGVLVITGEYGTGMIRSTFAAVPRRWPAVLAKLIVLAVVTLVLSLISIVVTAALTALILPSKGIPTRLTDPLVYEPLFGAAVYLALIAVFAFVIGTIVRNGAAGIAITLGVLLVVPIVLGIVYALTRLVWLENVATILPASAGGHLYAYAGTASSSLSAPVVSGVWSFNAWQGGLILLAWDVVLGILAFVLVKSRDA